MALATSTRNGTARIIPTSRVLDVPIAAMPYQFCVEQIAEWGANRESRVVCVANVHMLVEAKRSSEFSAQLVAADLVVPDGMPLVWSLRRRGYPFQERVAGMDLLPSLCAAAVSERVSVYFVGSTEAVLGDLSRRLAAEHPGLRVAGLEALPFRELTAAEDADLVARINESGAGMLFVALGCPKQERWMFAHRGRVNAVMVGLGAAFVVHAGHQRRAPAFMQRAGLEWFYRLMKEPRRLWKRYLDTNTAFVWYLLRERRGRETGDLAEAETGQGVG